MAEDLPGLLADNGIRLARLAPGHNEKLVCPKCEGGRTREKSLSVKIDPDGDGATWQCHRGTCGWTGGERVRPEDAAHRRRPAGYRAREQAPQKPRPHASAQTSNKPDAMYQFFADRKIGARTVDEFGCYVAMQWFQQVEGEREAIVFPYLFRGEVVNRKFRDSDKNFAQEKGALHTLFNVDRLRDPPDEVIFVEGEMDVLALFECGIPNAVSLKDGAGKEARFNPEDRRFTALTTHEELLAKVKRFVLAGDMDAPGLALREELARRFGHYRCCRVTWPDRCKDAGDVLMRHGPDAVTTAIENAEPYPLENVQEVTGDALLDWLQRPAPPLMTTGTAATDAVLRIPGDGRLFVLTGIPNHGKSTYLTFLSAHLIRKYDRKFLVFSPEMHPWERLASFYARIIIGKPLPGARATGPNGPMSTDELFRAGNWLRDRLWMLLPDPEQLPTLDWLLDRLKAAVLRDGITDFILDPSNDLDLDLSRLTETEAIRRMLQRLRSFAQAHGVNIWIVAHPTKQFPAKPGEKILAPGPYEINGSAHWANKSDVIITVHNAGDKTEIHLGKVKFSEWGRRGSMATLDFDGDTGRFFGDAPRPLAGEDAP